MIKQKAYKKTTTRKIPCTCRLTKYCQPVAGRKVMAPPMREPLYDWFIDICTENSFTAFII